MSRALLSLLRLILRILRKRIESCGVL